MDGIDRLYSSPKGNVSSGLFQNVEILHFSEDKKRISIVAVDSFLWDEKGH